MRLIDADELKENLLGEWYVEPNATIFDHVFDLIDNAPTIKEMPEKYIIQVKTKEDAQKIKNVWDKSNFGNVIITSDKFDVIPIRPQGEWIKIGEIGLAYTCNNCGENNVLPTNFCPNCGADMRGKEE